MVFAIGTCAYPGSGQDTIADIIVKKYSEIRKYNIGDMFREVAVKRGIQQTRENLQQIRKECDEKYGNRNYLPRKLSEKILHESCIPIITGIRTKEELEVFKNYFDEFHLVFVYADEEIRFNRLVKRADDRDPKTFDEFKFQMEREEEMYDLKDLKNNADYQIECNMTLEELETNSDDVLNSLIFLEKINSK